MTKKQKKKHKHSWQQESADCPFCGGGDYVSCGCGETKELIYLKNGKHKLRKLF